MMTEFERKVAVWQFGQIGRLLGSRETIRQGGNDPVQGGGRDEGVLQTFALLRERDVGEVG